MCFFLMNFITSTEQKLNTTLWVLGKMALATATCQNLGLHHEVSGANVLGDLLGLCRGLGQPKLGDGDPSLLEEGHGHMLMH